MAEDFEALDQEGRALLRAGKNEQALSVYERAVREFPQESTAWNNHGHTLDQLGRVEESLASFERALELNDGDPAAWLNRSRAKRQLGRLDAALADAMHAHELDENNAGIWNTIGVTLEELARLPEAVAAYDRAVALAPGEPLFERNHAQVASRLPQNHDALDAYEEALNLNPGSLTVATARLRVLREAGEKAQALAASAALTEARPRDPATWKLHGDVCLEAGHMADALKAFDTALFFDAECAEARDAKTQALQQAGWAKAAAACSQRTLAIDATAASEILADAPPDLAPHLPEEESTTDFAAVYERRQAMSEMAWLKALDEASGDTAAWGLLWFGCGLELTQQGELILAQKFFRGAVQRSEDNAYAWDGMATYHSQRGDRAQAQSCWLNALRSRGLPLFDSVRSAALNDIVEHGDDAQIWHAATLALDDPYHMVRARAVVALAHRFGNKPAREAEVVRALQSALSDGVLTVRMAVVKGIEELAASARVPLLKRAAANENWEVRETAVLVASRCGAADALMTGAAADEHADVRKANARMLASVQGDRATRLLLQALADVAPAVRGEAVSGLRGRAAEPAVRRALEGSLTDWHVSQSVLPILRGQGWKPANERDVVHEHVARRDGKALRADLRGSAAVLMSDIRYEKQGGLMQGLRQAFGVDPVPAEFRKYRTIENALYAFIGLGQAEHLPQLVATLNATDDRTTAEAFLNCGHAQLAEAAREWARVRGFTINSGFGAHPVSWGAL